VLTTRSLLAVAAALTLALGCGSSDTPGAAAESSGASGGGSSATAGKANAGTTGAGTSGNGSPSGGSTAGGTANAGATSAAGGATSGAGTSTMGGSTPGGTGSGGGTAGGAMGGAATGGAVNGGSAGTSTGGSGSPGGCDPGTTATTWAATCPATAEACTAGTWVAGGPDPDHSGFTLRAESTHFAVYADESSTSSTTAQAAVTHLETVWNLYFGSPMYMREPLCSSETKYKASIHVHSDWGLTGGSWSSGRMGMWIGTGGLSDHWGLAHEFMHGVQAVQGGMACNQANTCGWIYESHANWAAQQQGEYHTKDVHCSEMLPNASHLYLGSTRDRYCNWQFMEYLKDKYCYSAVNAIWTGKAAADPFTAIMNAQGWSVAELNDFFGEWAMHNVTWDYQDPAPSSSAGDNLGALFRSKYGLLTDASKSERRLRLTQLEPLELDLRRFAVPALQAPQRWGYDIVRLYPDAGAASVTVTFRGVIQAAANPDFRWGLVATDAGTTTPRYSALQRGTDGVLEFCVAAEESLFLVVMATPGAMQQIVWDQLYPSIYRYPYMVGLTNAWPDGHQGGTPAACPSGTVRVTNGGGCGPSSLPASVFVGPFAQVLGGTVSGDARIEDHAVVLGGTVSGGTISGLSIVKSGMTISSGTEKLSWPYAAGWFESPQSLAGATLLGDLEYRGADLNKTSGSYCGFVDSGVNDNCSGADVTTPPPYAWR
jgi:hypothetical protein